LTFLASILEIHAIFLTRPSMTAPPHRPTVSVVLTISTLSPYFLGRWLIKCIECYQAKTNISTGPLINALHECNGKNGTSNFSGSGSDSGSSTPTGSSTGGAAEATNTKAAGTHSGSGHFAVSVGVMGVAMVAAAAFVGY
jgi:hypothetical protein